MNLEDVISIVDSGELDKLKSTLEISKIAYFVNDAFTGSGPAGNNSMGRSPEALHICDAKQYNPKHHKVHDDVLRADKYITNDAGDIIKKIEVARLSMPEQKKIVLMASTFLGSPELNATPNPGIETEMFSLLNTISEDNKLDYKFRDITKRTMSERECAELWYTQDAEPDYWDGTPLQGTKFKLRMRILSPSQGDTLYPVWDAYGDMVAFGRYYETVEGTPDQIATNKTYHFDIYTADRFFFMTKAGKDAAWEYNYDPTADVKTPDGSVTRTKGVKNVIGKIPVIYYSQPATEWNDVQEMIDRLEKKISNHADTNDYFDSPIVVASGEIEGFSNKGEQGKLLQAKDGAKVEYLTWNNAPESMKMEIDNLVKNIHTYTHTPDISFESIKGLGAFSGIALKMFFMDAHLKAADKEELFGQGVQRRLNYLKSAIAVLNGKFKPATRLIVRPVFTFFLPRDEQGEVNTLIAAYGAGIISLESAVKQNPLVGDAVVELEKIKIEQSARQADAQKNALELAKTVHHSQLPIGQPLPVN